MSNSSINVPCIAIPCPICEATGDEDARIAALEAEVKEQRELLENFSTSSLIPSDVAVHRIRAHLNKQTSREKE